MRDHVGSLRDHCHRRIPRTLYASGYRRIQTIDGLHPGAGTIRLIEFAEELDSRRALGLELHFRLPLVYLGEALLQQILKETLRVLFQQALLAAR